MRRIAYLAAALAAATVASVTAAAAPALAVTHHPAACSTAWGTNAKHAGPTATVPTPIQGVRAGKHACFDRLVVDLGSGPRPGYNVQYVRQILAQGSGRVLFVRGNAKILIVLRAPAGSTYHANAANLVNVTGFATFRQVRGAGSFERVTSIGLGVRAKLAFRVSLLGTTSAWRLVIDVAH